MTQEPATQAGRALLAELRADVPWFVAGSQAAETGLILAIEAEAAKIERERIRANARISLSPMPIWAHVDAFKLGRVLEGEPWPEDRSSLISEESPDPQSEPGT